MYKSSVVHMDIIYTTRKLFILIALLSPLVSCQKCPTLAYNHTAQPAPLHKQHGYNHPPPPHPPYHKQHGYNHPPHHKQHGYNHPPPPHEQHGYQPHPPPHEYPE